MKSKPLISSLFAVAAVYDGLLGAAFLLIPRQVFTWVDVLPPNHLGYAQFPAALLVIFAFMYAAVALDPVKNRNLIPYGALLKVSYCGVVLFHWVSTDLPWIWKPFFVADLVFLALFVGAWRAIGRQEV